MLKDLSLSLNVLKRHLCSLFIITALGLLSATAQIKYVPHDERSDAGMGVDRIARFFTATYESKAAQKDEEIRWVQLDLGEKKKIDGIKLLPKVSPWGYVQSIGFPARFKIEMSDDPDFKTAVMYENRTREIFQDPYDVICTFDGKEVNARYVRLTALQLRQKRLAMSKIMVMSDGKDIAEGCPASDSESGNLGVSVLTRPTRPQGEGVVTNNPGNIIPSDKWNPVAYKAQAPKGGVQLGDGLFKTTMENNITYLLSSFTFDELVRNFYLKAGRPVKPLEERLNNFWFVDLPGQEAGRFLMGAGNTLRWMENAELRTRMNRIVDVIDECKEPDGYIMAYPKNKIFAGEYGAYTRSWVTHGLIEAGYAGNTKAFPLLRGFYDWFNTSCYLPEMLRRAGQGSQGIIPSTRMYFTPVGKPKDIEVVQQYFQENYWMEQMADRDEKAIWLYPYDRPHNYLLTAIEPYLDLYRATGAKKYLDAASGAWDLYHNNWEHVGGSIAICEGTDLYPPKSYYLHRSTGELCGSVFWAFLNQRFHLLNPDDEKYVAEIEKSIYNNLIANQVGDKGIRYHAVLADHKDVNNRQPFSMSTCCEGQGTRMIGALPEFIYSVAGDGVYVDLFASSTIKFPTQTGTMSLKMDTRFPYDQKVLLTVNADRPVKSKIRIRVPSWAAGEMPVMVNGKKVVKGKPGTYVSLDRNWNNGDVISFYLPMNFRMTKYEGEERDPDHERFALEYGPVLMAYVSVKGKTENIKLTVSPEKLIKSLTPADGKPLHFKVKGNNDFVYMPYFEVQDESFTCFP
ncbi:MAG: glycoside hydrolase family 127 protein [Bacteroidales bacterium]|nr:glycoside hydrolase family 127 protein [Bacteroidales bacterium]